VSKILSVLRMGVDGGHPELSVRCHRCRREYVTKVPKAQARKARSCVACKPVAGRALPRGGPNAGRPSRQEAQIR
jgi:hypothetical protein